MKRYIFLLLILGSLFSPACKQKEDNRGLLFCTQLLSDSTLVKEQTPKAAAEEAFLWPHPIDMGLYLTVKFLNGTDFQRKKVMQYAAEWENASQLGWNGRHKIKFGFVGNTYPPQAYTDVRILFQPGGSASNVGWDCKNVPQDQPTTVFGWVDPSHSEAQIRQVILHELGHVLGLVHEHQSPAANIPWDSVKVYQYYHDTQLPPWDHAKVDWNVFRRYDASRTNYTAFDSLSIMLYAIPSYLTINGYSTPWNDTLSATDRAFIKKIYPYEPCIPNETCCFDRRGRRIPCP